MIYKQIKNSIEKLGGGFYIVELLVILLLCTYVLGNFGGFSNIVWVNKIDVLGQKKTLEMVSSFSNIVWVNKIDVLGQKKTLELIRSPIRNGINVSFLRNNLVIDWDYYGYLSTSGKKKVIWPDGNIYSGPVFLSLTEKKPYYLYNIDVQYAIYHLRFFRNFTKGDGTIKFAEQNNEIKALVFYKKDSAKVMQIKREIEKIEWEDKNGGGNTMGILFF